MSTEAAFAAPDGDRRAGDVLLKGKVRDGDVDVVHIDADFPRTLLEVVDDTLAHRFRILDVLRARRQKEHRRHRQ